MPLCVAGLIALCSGLRQALGDQHVDNTPTYLLIISIMIYFTSQQAAKKLGIALTSLIRYVADKKVPAPQATRIGKREVRAWTDEDIQRVRKILPKIANGRKTRYQKKQSALSSQHSVKAKPKKQKAKKK